MDLRLDLLHFLEHVSRQTPTQCVAIEGQLKHSVLERIANVIWALLVTFDCGAFRTFHCSHLH